MPNRNIEIHDSTLEKVSVNGPNAILELSCVIHQSEGTPGWDSGSCWVQEARLYIAGVTVTGGISDLPRDLWDGTLRLDERFYENTIPIPLDFHGNVQLDLEGIEAFKVVGSHVRLELLGEAKYLEEFSGHE
jgi:hypothetical protein